MRASTRSAWVSGISLIWVAAISAQTGLSQSGLGNPHDPRQTLVLAKTAAIVAQAGEVSQTGRWTMDPSPERASNALQKALQKWGRLKLVEEADQADLVLLIIEGNRSGFLKKGELFERLVVFRGGPSAAQNKTPLWEEEAKEGLGGRPAGKLIDHLRKQIEDYEKAGAAMSAQVSSQSEPGRAALPPSADPGARAEPSTVVEAKVTPPSQAMAPAEAHPSDSALGGRMESRMLQPVPDKFVPSAELLKAKTAAVISYGPQPEGGAKGIVGTILTGTSSQKQADAHRARKDVENEMSKWKRYNLVDNPTQADIVIAVREWNHTGILGREYLACRMAVFKGGADFEQKLEMLWAEEYETDFGSTTKLVAKDLRHVVEKLAKQTKAE